MKGIKRVRALDQGGVRKGIIGREGKWCKIREGWVRRQGDGWFN